MPERSAGLLLYRGSGSDTEFFLVHPGGPFWAKKDEGAWSIPKGLYSGDEDPLAAARRETREETGFDVAGPFTALGEFKQPSGKRISAWSVPFDCDPLAIVSNSFAIEWPPRSGRMQEYPEVDRGGWFTPRHALAKILKGQRPILLRAAELLGVAVDMV
jgi:predicted NUDIX family NTP pyrophosphohydrolase